MKLDRCFASNKFLIRDPVHGYILFDKNKYEFLIKVMDTFEFQRLRRKEDDRRIRKFFEERDIPYDYYFAYDEIEKTSVERPILEKGLLMVDIDKSDTVSELFDLVDESDIIRSVQC